MFEWMPCVCATDVVAVVSRFVFPLKGQSDIKCWRKNNMKYYFASHSCQFGVCYSNVWMPVSPVRISLIWDFFHFITLTLLWRCSGGGDDNRYLYRHEWVYLILCSAFVSSRFSVSLRKHRMEHKRQNLIARNLLAIEFQFSPKKYASTAGCRSTFSIISITRRTEMIFQWRAAKATHTHISHKLTECFDVFKCRLISAYIHISHIDTRRAHLFGDGGGTCENNFWFAEKSLERRNPTMRMFKEANKSICKKA